MSDLHKQEQRSTTTTTQMARQRQSSDSISESVKKVLSPTAEISGDLPPRFVNQLLHFFADVGVTAVIPGHCNDKKDFYSDVVTNVLKPLRIEPGSVSCLLTAKPSILVSFSASISELPYFTCCLAGEKILRELLVG